MQPAPPSSPAAALSLVEVSKVRGIHGAPPRHTAHLGLGVAADLGLGVVRGAWLGAGGVAVGRLRACILPQWPATSHRRVLKPLICQLHSCYVH